MQDSRDGEVGHLKTVIFKYRCLELIFHQVKNVHAHTRVCMCVSYHVHLAEVQMCLVCAH